MSKGKIAPMDSLLNAAVEMWRAGGYVANDGTRTTNRQWHRFIEALFRLDNAILRVKAARRASGTGSKP